MATELDIARSDKKKKKNKKKKKQQQKTKKATHTHTHTKLYVANVCMQQTLYGISVYLPVSLNPLLGHYGYDGLRKISLRARRWFFNSRVELNFQQGGFFLWEGLVPG